jgi:hypothetical protein
MNTHLYHDGNGHAAAGMCIDVAILVPSTVLLSFLVGYIRLLSMLIFWFYTLFVSMPSKAT